MSSPLTFRLLGGASIGDGDEPLTDFRSRTAEALRIYLACHEQPLSRQFLADFFWDDRSQKQAAANLRSILSTLRKQVGEYLVVDRQRIGFNHERASWLDAAEFESQLGALQPSLQRAVELDGATAQALEKALNLYQGDFLDGFHLNESRGFEEWILVNRERLRRLAVTGLRRLVQYYLANGRYQAGITFADRLIAADPYNEAAQRQRMWLLVRSGSRNQALQSYLTFQKLLAEDLRVEPAPATTAVFERISQLTFPPPHNLSPHSAPFVGRESEIQELVEDLVRPDSRLISLIGPGGVGKTNLAAQVGQQLSTFRPGCFLDGVWFVSLAPIHSARFMVTALANVVGLTFKGAAAPEAQLLEYLKEREMLLILDNFEQLLAGREETLSLVTGILEAAPTVKLLVTTRERLNLREEQIFRLEGLPYPDDPALGLEEAGQYSAVTLFIQRAKRVSRRFHPDGAELEAIIRLCQLLEGMPLGLEMAAAWIWEASVGEILGQLQQSFDGLETIWPNVPERHRSIRAVFDHSWELLTAGEQAGFTRLAVFQGGFTADAATKVSGVAKPSLFQGKSLLRQSKNGRYDFHGLIQQFAAEILARDSAGFTAVRRQHADYYMGLLQEQEPFFIGGKVEDALTLLDAEIENIRLAWQWALDEMEIELLAQGYLSLYLYYETRGWFEVGESHFKATVSAVESRLGPVAGLEGRSALIFGRLLSREGWFAYRSGQLVRAKTVAEQGATIFRRLGAKKDLAQSLNDLGILSRRQGEYQKARDLLSEALAIRREIDDQRGVTASLNNLANAVRMLGEYDQARAYLLESLNLLEEQGNLILAANAFNDLGEIARATGDFEEARKYYEESLAIRQKIGIPSGIAICLNNLGSVAHTQGDYESARGYARESLRLFVETGNRRAATYPLSVLGRIARDEADFGNAFASFRRALQICHEISYLPKSLDILFELATVYEAMEQPARAARLLALVIEHPKINFETRKAAEEMMAKMVALLEPEMAEGAQAAGRQDTLENVMTAFLRGTVWE